MVEAAGERGECVQAPWGGHISHSESLTQCLDPDLW